MSSNKPLCRRRFLQLAAGAAATAACAPSSPGSSAEAVGDAAAGNVSALAVGQLKAVPGVAAAIGRDANGLYAMSLTCTHEGCAMNSGITATKIICDCHGSEFDKNGAVLQGPARSPLPHYRVSVDGSGNITVHGADSVAADVRTAV